MTVSPLLSATSRLSRLLARAGFGLVLLLSPGLWNPLFGRSIDDDETVVFFPTDAYLNSTGKHWVIPIHGWIFELEEGSLWREFTIDRLPWLIEADPETLDPAIYERRARLFLVDNHRGKEIQIALGGKSYRMAPSAPNGHFFGAVTIPANQGTNTSATDGERSVPLPLSAPPTRDDTATEAEGARPDWVRFQALTPPGSKPRSFQGKSHLVPPTGISVISDIDDTIKVSNVTDKQKLLRNTFFKEFRPVPCMPEAYGQWADQGAIFHYVSGSPWQLYPPLSRFIEAAGIPQGAFHLKYVRAKDRTLFNLFIDQNEYKAPLIEALFERYPDRRFILVGDAGEKDPEVYGAFARRYPRRVLHIFIRETVPGTSPTDERYRLAFADVPAGRWSIFDDACSLKGLDLRHSAKIR